MGQHESKSIPLTKETISSLNCPVCFEIPSENQIYQCENGHTTCKECASKIQNKNCPQCRTKMFKTRFTNFVSNNALPKISIPCPFENCTVKENWSKIQIHKETCIEGQRQRKREMEQRILQEYRSIKFAAPART